MSTPLVAPFADLAAETPDVCGGKGWGLVAMAANDFAVAPGFVVTDAAFRAFLDTDDLRVRIGEIVAGIRAGDPVSLAEASERLRHLVGGSELPPDVRAAVVECYDEMSRKVGVSDVPVAVRSSASAEDSAAASFAGEFESWIDVVGAGMVLEHVRTCYQSLYQQRSLAYMVDGGLDPTSVSMAVVVQKTVRARSAGVMFTLDPLNGDRSAVVIEANWGLGLGVVGGEVVPDRFVVDKVTREITQSVVGSKETAYMRGDRAPIRQTEEKRNQLCMSAADVLRLAELGCRLEKFHGAPQDVEFAIDEELPSGDNLVLLQCRPETYWRSHRAGPLFSPEESIMSWVSQVMSAPDQSVTPRAAHHHG